MYINIAIILHSSNEPGNAMKQVISSRTRRTKKLRKTATNSSPIDLYLTCLDSIHRSSSRTSTTLYVYRHMHTYNHVV